MTTTGLIFDIKRFSVNDGPGIRTTVFFKGCPLDCRWCHNPESRKCEPEEILTNHKLDGRAFHDKETIGSVVTVRQVMTEIEKENIFYETSQGGVTFSGGEPLLQPEFLSSLADACRFQGIHVCLDTSGYCEPRLFKELIPKFDLFLYDIKLPDRENHIRYTGFPNDDILTNLWALDSSGKDYIIRMPYIPGVNDSREAIDQLKELLKQLTHRLKEIHFLPYHPLAKSKLKRMGLEDKMNGSIQVDELKLGNLVSEFEKTGYRVKIGG